ncbi:LysR family transcriptional regulator [Dactylosporangium sp. CA-092794]|uniref:LysR family transcriptional regulator n=1 Tax=Dactylosporangium sp. CA-092794 TaxID=3239929 RepID=UPI003D92D35B
MDVNYTIRQLQYFAAVAQTGTISAAASRVHVSQSALSLAVSQLERGLGVKLLVRHRAKGVELTPAGTRLLALAESLLAQAADLQTKAGVERGGALSGTLAVGCYTTLAPIYVPPLLTGFKEECPDIVLELAEYAQPELQRDLHEAVLELALLYDFQLDADLEYIEVQTLYPHVLMSEDHRFANDATVSLTALANEPMILFDVPPSRENWERMMNAIGIEPMIGHRTHNFELTRCLVGRGLGYAMLFQRPPVDLTYEGRRVVARPIEESVPPIRLVLAYPSRTNLTARAHRFAEFTIATFGTDTATTVEPHRPAGEGTGR